MKNSSDSLLNVDLYLLVMNEVKITQLKCNEFNPQLKFKICFSEYVICGSPRGTTGYPARSPMASSNSTNQQHR